MPTSQANRTFAQLNRCSKQRALANEQQRMEAGTATKGLFTVAKNTYHMRPFDAKRGICQCTSQTCAGCFQCVDKGAGTKC